MATVDANDNSLWLVKPTADALALEDGREHIGQLTTTTVYTVSGRAVAAPAGSDFLIFVDSDNNLRYIDGSEEEVINDDGDWSSIAISPDWSRLVATSVNDEPYIWYLDLEQPENSTRIELYHPTTQEGIRQDIVKYADALQWDPNSTYVIYDVLNSLPGPDGEPIEFWTINVLEPTSETIWPLFPPQPEGVHIANPSRTSAFRVKPDTTFEDCRMLYERVDVPNARTEISVMDFCKGGERVCKDCGEGVLFTWPEPIFTYPGFINGDREIIFQLPYIEDDVLSINLFRQPLTDDGFSPLGDPLGFVPDSLYPMAFILAGDASADIIATAAPPAPNPDFDGDGTVGFSDFLQFASRFGSGQGDTGFDAKYDLDGDGSVGLGDFLIFASAFGS